MIIKTLKKKNLYIMKGKKYMEKGGGENMIYWENIYPWNIELIKSANQK